MDEVAQVREIMQSGIQQESVGEADVNAAKQILEGDSNDGLSDLDRDIKEAIHEEENADLVEDAAAEDQDLEEETTATEGAEGVEESYSVASLAEAIGWNPEELYDVDVPMGEGVEPVKLGQLKDSYQQTVKEKADLEAKVQELDAAAKNVGDMSAMGQGVSQEMIKAFANMDSIQTAYQNYDWKTAEETDPGQAALARQKFQEAFQHGQAQVVKAQQNMDAYKQQNLQKAAGVMMEIIPEWKDVEARKADQSKIREVMKAEGYTDQMINGIGDPKAMKLLRELVQLREKVATYEGAGKEAMNKVRKAPKVLASRARVKADKGKNFKRLKAEARNARTPTDRKKAEMAAVKSLLGG